MPAAQVGTRAGRRARGRPNARSRRRAELREARRPRRRPHVRGRAVPRPRTLPIWGLIRRRGRPAGRSLVGNELVFAGRRRHRSAWRPLPAQGTAPSSGWETARSTLRARAVRHRLEPRRHADVHLRRRGTALRAVPRRPSSEAYPIRCTRTLLSRADLRASFGERGGPLRFAGGGNPLARRPGFAAIVHGSLRGTRARPPGRSSKTGSCSPPPLRLREPGSIRPSPSRAPSSRRGSPIRAASSWSIATASRSGSRFGTVMPSPGRPTRSGSPRRPPTASTSSTRATTARSSSTSRSSPATWSALTMRSWVTWLVVAGLAALGLAAAVDALGTRGRGDGPLAAPATTGLVGPARAGDQAATRGGVRGVLTCTDAECRLHAVSCRSSGRCARPRSRCAGLRTSRGSRRGRRRGGLGGTRLRHRSRS